MYAHLGARRGAAFKSRPGAGHDLYHEYVVAHLGKQRTAIVYREGQSWERASYETLHARSNALAASWQEAGVAAGDIIAIVAPAGVEQAAALLTAFRLGLVAAPIAPVGRALVRDAVARIAPDHIAATVSSRALLSPNVESLLTSAGVRLAGAAASYSYAADAPVARLLAPFGTNDEGVVDVSAQVLLDGSSRDAALVYALDPADAIAAPGFDPARHEPSLLLTALAAGATYVALDERALRSEPSLLASLRVTTLGVSPRIRDALLELGAALPAAVRAWFRSLSDVIDAAKWDAFTQRVLTRKQPGFGVLSASAAGGVGLFSAPSPGPATLRAWPAPGLTWQLGELAAGNVPALNDAGVFTILQGEEGDPAFPQAIVGRFGEGFAYAGSLDIGPSATRYPHALVERLVETLDDVQHAVTFTTPGRHLNEVQVVLLVFVEGGVRGAPVVELSAIEAALTRELGAALVPSRIDVLPLRPRLRDGVVDHAWCRSQYLTGALHRKARSELFVRLARLGYIFAQKRAPR